MLASFSRQKFLVSKNILPLDQQEQSKAAFSHPNYYNNNLIFQGRKFQVFKWVGFVFLLFFKSFFFFFSYQRAPYFFSILSLVALLALFGRQRDLAICRTAKVG